MARIAPRFPDDPDEGRPTTEEVRGQSLNGIVPKLVQTTTDDSGREQTVREFSPLSVTRLGGKLPWETESTQLQCGETVTSTTGDQNNRIVYGCYCTHTQFKTLVAMRDAPTGIKLVSAAFNDTVSFDQLNWERVPEANGAIVDGGEDVSEPIYEIQLQSKEEDEEAFAEVGEE